MYKIIKDDKIIDVVRAPKYILFLPTGHIAFTSKALAQGIVSSDNQTVYSFTRNKFNKPVVKIQEITLEEFNRLYGLLNSGVEVSADESDLEKAKQSKIQSLSNICKNRIISGFSIVLSDNAEYDFKLTTEDQLNLMLIENQLYTGESQFIYHATNQPCRLFNKDDMIKIINKYKHFVLYHTTYFNAAKQYINKLTDITKVNLFSYGNDVSEIVDDVVLKQILKNGENI